MSRLPDSSRVNLGSWTEPLARTRSPAHMEGQGQQVSRGARSFFSPDFSVILFSFFSDNVAAKQTDYGYRESAVHIYNIVTQGKSRRTQDTKT